MTPIEPPKTKMPRDKTVTTYSRTLVRTRTTTPKYLDMISEGFWKVPSTSWMRDNSVRSRPKMMKAIARGMPTITKNPAKLANIAAIWIITSCQFLLIILKPFLIASPYFIATPTTRSSPKTGRPYNAQYKP